MEEIESKMSRSERLLGRYTQIEADRDQLQFENFFNEAIANVQSRQELMNEVSELDRQQAEDYQRNFKKFEKEYFGKFMEGLQDQQ
jgi:hypothetical protein|mmetsp:Transcript_9149/g.12458  ORF Transcript_9149/g.12458 Transcript_9149/m.12458 type:complete len:86 (-) Transcript_9149:380-637(-)